MPSLQASWAALSYEPMLKRGVEFIELGNILLR
jgi:hypothetical protein